MTAYILKRILLMLPDAVRRAADDLRGDAVRAGRAGGAVHRRSRGARGGGARRRRRRYRGGQGVDPKKIEQIKALYGFDKPPHERFWKMLGQFARFDLGRSFFQNKDVWQLIKEKLPVSISLGLWTFFISYLIAVPLGVAKAVRAGSRFDFVTTLVVLVGYAIPGFVLGVALLVIFGGQLQWFPLRGLTSSNWDELGWGARIVDYLWHITLPVTAMVLGSFAVTTMLTKNAFLEEIRKQYVLTARAKGLSERRVLWKHVFRNALIPIVTGFPAAFIGAFFTGSLLIETLFSLDGLGLLSYESVIRRDYPVVLGTLYLFTLIGLVTKLISDLCYVWVDPACQVRLSALPARTRGRGSAARQPASAAPPRSSPAARLAAVPAQPARLLEPGDVRHAGGAEPVRRGAVQRQAAGGALQGRVLFPDGAATTRRTTFGGDFATPTDYLDPVHPATN